MSTEDLETKGYRAHVPHWKPRQGWDSLLSTIWRLSPLSAEEAMSWVWRRAKETRLYLLRFGFHRMPLVAQGSLPQAVASCTTWKQGTELGPPQEQQVILTAKLSLRLFSCLAGGRPSVCKLQPGVKLRPNLLPQPPKFWMTGEPGKSDSYEHTWLGHQTRWGMRNPSIHRMYEDEIR